MSVKAVRAALSIQDLPTVQKFVLVILAEHAGDTNLSWPSNALVAQEAAISRETVVRAIASLRQDGLIQESGRVRQVIRWKVDLAACDRRSHVIVSHMGCDPQSRQGVIVGHITCDPPSHGTVKNRKGTTKEPTTTVSETPLTLVADLPPAADSFDAWWVHYPRKVAKADARKAYATATKRSGVTPAFLLAAVQAYKFDARDGYAYAPHPATWLRGKRWEDDKAAQVAPSAKGPTPVSNWAGQTSW